MHKPLSIQRIVAATLLLALGVYLISNVTHFIPVHYLGYFSLLLTGTIAYIMVFGSNAYKELFQKPISYWKNVIKYFLLTVVFSFVLGNIVVLITHTQKGNDAANNPIWFFFLIMPFALIGEELFSLYFYNLFNVRFSPLVANLLGCIIFGLIHYTTYFNGSVLLTLFQIIILQGSARFWFNRSYEQSRSILTSFTVHYFFDFVTFMFALFVTRH